MAGGKKITTKSNGPKTSIGKKTLSTITSNNVLSFLIGPGVILVFAIVAALTRSLWDPYGMVAHRFGFSDSFTSPPDQRKEKKKTTTITTAKSKVMDDLCPPGDKICEMNAKLPQFANPEGKPRAAEKVCEDRHDQCKGFLSNGECSKNPGWMIVNCPKSCKACHLRDPAVRCPRNVLNMTQEPIYQPGDMNKMFERIVDRFGSRYEVNILSRDPWIVTLDNFISMEESKALITATGGKWERSTDTGTANEFGETYDNISLSCRAKVLLLLFLVIHLTPTPYP